MATVTATDFLVATGTPGLWVRLHNNVSGTDYYSTAVSDPQGAFTYTAPTGEYSLYVGNAATVPGTPTLRNAHFQVAVRNGDDAALGSATVLASSPYASASVAGSIDNVVFVAPPTGVPATDSANIQSALTTGAGLEVRLFPSQTAYVVNASSTISSNTLFRGNGPFGGGIKVANGANLLNGVITGTGTTGVSIQDLFIDGNKANQATGSGGIVLYSTCAKPTIQGCRVLNTYENAIQLQSVTDALVAFNSFETCGGVIEGNGLNSCVRITGINAARIRIHGNRFEQPVASAIFNGGTNSSDLIITDNVVNQPGAYCVALGTSAIRFVISYNRLIGLTAGTIYNNIDFGTGLDCQVSNNVVSGGLNGISNGGPSFRTVINNNVIRDAINAGIVLGGTAGAGNNIISASVTGNVVINNGWQGIAVDSAGDVVIADNICKNNNQAGGAARGGISVNSTYAAINNVRITGNRCTDDQGSKTQDYGIQFAQSSGANIVCEHNDFSGNKTTNLFNPNATGLLAIRNNIGYNPSGQTITTPAFPANTIQITNTTNSDVVAYIVNGNNTCLINVDGGNLYTIPATGLATVVIPAGSTFKPTYGGTTPTWVWYGL